MIHQLWSRAKAQIRSTYYAVAVRILAVFFFGRYDPGLISLQMGIDANPILKNAERLTADAHILIANKRYATALALAVIAFEEIGKYLLAQWGEDPEFTYDRNKKHVMKQAAVAALFTTLEIRKSYRAANINFESMSDVEVLRLYKCIQEGSEAGLPFAEMVIKKVYENVKWSGLYYDPEIAKTGIEPANITEENAREIMALTIKAFNALPEDGNIYIARHVFVSTIEKLSTARES